MTQVPAHLQDASQLLSEAGFASGDIWYHGTSSALLDSIMAQGLKGSGDQASQQARTETMATIGDKEFSPTPEPLFVTQSRELAYYWAEQCVARRRALGNVAEQPLVLALQLPVALREQVRPDVGAAALLITRTDDYFDHLEALYQACGLDFPPLHPSQTARSDYLDKLGMAYIEQTIAPEYLRPLTA